jgi:predicted nucleotidyltransferase component of viral defense system
MRAIAQSFRDTPMVLKGGTALLLGYGLNRFSEDLDFNSPTKLNLENRIKAAKPIGVQFENLRKTKDTETTSRYRLTYNKDGISQNLKIEVSHRDGVAPFDVTEIDGIKIYKPEKLVDQKIEAALDRTAMRDIFDLNFLIASYKECFSNENLRDMHKLTHDVDALESRYKQAYDEDTIVNSTIDLEDLVLQIHTNTQDLIKERSGPQHTFSNTYSPKPY